MFLALILESYFMYVDKLFQDSYESVIPTVQESHAGKEDSKGWAILSFLSLFSLTNGSLAIILANQKDRAAAFYFVMIYVSQVFLIGCLQLLLQRPAPFWVTPDVLIF